MKKMSKLLVSIIGSSTIATTIVPIVSCGSSKPTDPVEEKGNVSFDTTFQSDVKAEAIYCVKDKESKFKLTPTKSTDVITDVELIFGEMIYMEKDGIKIEKDTSGTGFIITVPAKLMSTKDIVILNINISQQIDSIDTAIFTGASSVEGEGSVAEDVLPHYFSVKGTVGGTKEVKLELGGDYRVFKDNIDVTDKISNFEYLLPLEKGKITFVIKGTLDETKTKNIEVDVKESTNTVVYKYQYDASSAQEGKIYSDKQNLNNDVRIVLNISLESQQTTNTIGCIRLISDSTPQTVAEIDSQSFYINSSKRGLIPEAYYKYDEEKGAGKGGSRVLLYSDETKTQPYALDVGEDLTIVFNTKQITSGEYKFEFTTTKVDVK